MDLTEAEDIKKRWQEYTDCYCQVTSVVSNSVRPHKRQPTRLPCPWVSQGKNTGVGCHILLQCMKVKSENEVVQSCLTLSDPMDCSLPGSCVHGIFQARVLEWGAIAFSNSRLTYYLFSDDKNQAHLSLLFHVLVNGIFQNWWYYLWGPEKNKNIRTLVQNYSEFQKRNS